MFARKNLLHDKTRFLLSLLGIAGAGLLILLLEGLAAGIYTQVTAFVNNSGADLIVAQQGVNNMQASRSVLPRQVGRFLSHQDEVDKFAPIIVAPAMMERDDKKSPVMIIGYEKGQKLGRPWNLAEGRLPEKKDEAVFDLSLAQRYDLSLGQKTELMGKALKIVGLSRETSSWMNPYIFTTLETTEAMTGSKGTVSYFLVKSKNRAAAHRLKTNLLKEHEGISVLHRSRLASKDRAILEEMLGPAISLMVGISYLIGFLVIGLTMYASVLANLRAYGLIKALGASNWRLYGIVWRQALILAIASFLASVIFAQVAGEIIQAALPQFAVTINWPVILRTLIGITLTALAASALPIRKIARLDPASVFK